MITIITDKQLDELRDDISRLLTEKRYLHTLGVEREAIRLAELYCPHKKNLLRAAALLHDITKEYSADMHLSIMREHGIDTDYYLRQSKKIYHSLTASLIIGQKYPDFADDEIVHAVRVHTTGEADMSIFDKLIYLADYIEATRTFPDCVYLSEYVWNGIADGEDIHLHLDRTMLMSFDLTIRDLIDCGKVISDKTTEARNSLLLSMNKGV